MNTIFLQRQAGFLRIALSVLVLTSFSSCYDPDYFPCVSAIGQMSEETRVVSNFDGIDLAVHGQVFIYKGTVPSVSVTAPANLLPYIQTRVVAGKLIIDNDRCMRNRIDDIQIHVTMPDLKSLRIAGSGSVFTDELWTTENLYLDIAGSGQITGSFNSHSINTRISGSGDAELFGSADNHNIIISGSGQVYGFNLDCLNADVRISGSGHANVLVRENLNARISGSGNIYYRGNPSLKVNVSGSGKVIHK